MVVDELRDRVVVFGGTMYEGGSLPGSTFGDTWEWDGVRWLPHRLEGPADRFGAAACYDPTSHRVMIVSGIVNFPNGVSFAPSDQWRWDGSVWTSVTPNVVPPVGDNAAMVADPEHARVLWVGPSPSGRRALWSFDAQGWHQHVPPVPAAAPGPPIDSAGQPTTYDRLRRRLVVVENQQSVCEWDGQTWTRLTPPGGNPGQGLISIAFDPDSGRVLGLAYATAYDVHVYQWTGELWSDLGPIRGASFARSTLPIHIQTWLVPFRGSLLLAGSFGDPSVYYSDGSSDTDLFRFADLTEGEGEWTVSIHDSPPHPPTTAMHALAYDREKRAVVCFGGSRGDVNTTTSIGTWLLKGDRWKRLPAAENYHGHVVAGVNPATGRVRAVATVSPSPLDRMRELTNEAWSPLPTLVLNTGDHDTPHATNSVEGYDLIGGTSLRRIDTTVSPPIPTTGQIPPTTTGGADMTFDPLRNAFVLNGDAGTYLLNGTVWSVLQTQRRFPWYPRVVFDPSRGGVIGMPGWLSPPTPRPFPAETYFLGSAAAAWTTLPLRSPPARKYSAITWDPDAQRVICSGGSQHSTAYFRDTWKLAKGPASIGIPPASLSLTVGQTAVFEVVARGGA
ncbi:MAG: hypothetical protein K2Q09_01840 [Phycisphaerales bacterium]|nr:hypothetical protein [Phycisphaerales bacterium]